jgi:hypothetical protein
MVGHTRSGGSAEPGEKLSLSLGYLERKKWCPHCRWEVLSNLQRSGIYHPLMDGNWEMKSMATFSNLKSPDCTRSLLMYKRGTYPCMAAAVK